ncbi:MAG: ATP-binding protein [Gemmatimonadales bacterium]|nr:ATP-binding protein [Gemmatimonadales bacterium]
MTASHWAAVAGVVLLVGEGAGKASWAGQFTVAVLAAISAMVVFRAGGRTARAVTIGLLGVSLMMATTGYRLWRAAARPSAVAAGAVADAVRLRDRELARAIAGARNTGRLVLQRVQSAAPGETQGMADLVGGDGPEEGVVVLAGDTIVAVAGARRVEPVTGLAPVSLVTTPFARLLVIREVGATREAQVAILLDAGAGLPAPGRTLTALSRGWHGVEWRWSTPPLAEVRPFASAAEATAHLRETMMTVAPTADRLIAHEVRLGRWLAAAGLVGLVIMVLIGGPPPLVRAATLLLPTWAMARTLAAPSVTGGPLVFGILAGLSLLMFAVVLWRRPARRTPIGLGASVLLLASAPPMMFAVGRQLAPAIELSGVLGWFGWQAVLALGASAYLAIAAAPLRSGRDATATPKWGIIAAACAILVGAAGVVAWTPAGWLWWLAPLWAVPVAALLPVTSEGARRVAITTMAGVLAALAAWGASLDQRQQLAQADLDRLGARFDQGAVLALEALGERISAERLTRLDRLYSAWRGSEVATLETPTMLAVWYRGDPVEYVALDQLAVNWADLERVVEVATASRRRISLPRGSGRHEVLVVPLAGDTIVTVTIGPRSRIISPTRFGRLVDWRSPRDPAYLVRELPGITEPDTPEFRRSGRWIRADRLVESGAQPVVARAEIGISRNRPFAVRAAVTVLLDVLIVLTAWLVCRGLIGGGGGAVMGVFRRSYRRTVATTLAAFFLVPAVLFTFWSLLRLQQDSARERGAEVTRVLRNAMVRGELAQVTQTNPDRAALELLADGVGADLAIYRRGRLVAASTPLLAELGLLAPVIDPALARTESNEASTNVAGLPGVNLRLGVEQTAAPGTVLAAVLPGAEAQLQREQVDIALLLLLASLGGGIAAVVVAGLVARALGQPIEALARTALAIGHREPLPDLGDPPAEFEPVFGAIAQMEGDLRESEAELEAGRSRTEAILSTVATGVIGVSADGTVMHVNPRAEALLGIAVAREQPLIAQLPAGWEAVGEGVHRLLGPHTRDAESRELEIGELRVAVTVAPLGDGGLVIAVTDITEASRAARILAWGEMARQVAHEIKNPLTPMRLGLQHLKRLRADGRPEFAEQVDQTASRLLVEIDRLDRIARAFARYGGPTTGDDGPLEPVNLETAVREVVELYALAAGEPRVELVGESATPCAVRREELIQVLLNLLDNARSADAESVRLVLAPLQLQVRDDGRGISAEQVGRIFEPTFSTTTSGTGLGLAIVRRLVEGWGGTITVASEPGEGTTFTITFVPATAPTPDTLPA